MSRCGAPRESHGASWIWMTVTSARHAGDWRPHSHISTATHRRDGVEHRSKGMLVRILQGCQRGTETVEQGRKPKQLPSKAFQVSDGTISVGKLARTDLARTIIRVTLDRSRRTVKQVKSSCHPIVTRVGARDLFLPAPRNFEAKQKDDNGGGINV